MIQITPQLIVINIFYFLCFLYIFFVRIGVDTRWRDADELSVISAIICAGAAGVPINLTGSDH